MSKRLLIIIIVGGNNIEDTNRLLVVLPKNNIKFNKIYDTVKSKKFL